ncbi:MAG: hypothetical protein KKB70_08740, partial [Proteobacteria bacterium]|nr:hypothetical protein [Pseudomonadota bacterium]MBU1610648.1 hypothetical protein [Pseudomonadota bacterium]
SSAYDYYAQQRQEADAAQTRSTTSTLKSTDTSFGADVRKQIDALFADVPRGSNGKLTFDGVIAYRDEFRAAFKERVEADLAALGVDTDTGMTFSYDAKSDVLTVNKDHPDKKAIDAYFAANEDLRMDFAKLSALTKVTSMAERKLSLTDLRAEMQTQSMAWWAEANVPDAFTGGSLAYTSGSDEPTFFGLDMMV